MPASRIFRLARNSRWPSVCSATSSARAISAVVRPPSVRSGSASCASSASAGWQQVKMRRRRSSRIVSASTSSSSSATSGAGPSSAYFAASARWRRHPSIAFRLAAAAIQAAGLGGTPLRGQRSSATAKASWMASSAASKSPKERISAAATRPYSSRKTASTAARAAAAVIPSRARKLARRTNHRWTTKPPPPGFLVAARLRPTPTSHVPDGPHLGRAALRDVRHPGRPLDRLVEVRRLEDEEAAELLLRLGERPVAEQHLAVRLANGRGRAGGAQPLAGHVLAGALQILRVASPRLEHLRAVLRAHAEHRLLVVADQQQVAHGRDPPFRVVVRLADPP